MKCLNDILWTENLITVENELLLSIDVYELATEIINNSLWLELEKVAIPIETELGKTRR